MRLRYTVVLTRGNAFNDVTVAFNDRPHVGESVWYLGMTFTVKSYVQNF